MSDSEAPLQRQLDLICNAFEEGWSADTQSQFDEFLKQVDDEHRERLLRMLLEVDVELRLKAGQQVTPQDYLHLGEPAVAYVNSLVAPGDIDATLDPGPQGQCRDRNVPFDERLNRQLACLPDSRVHQQNNLTYKQRIEVFKRRGKPHLVNTLVNTLRNGERSFR